jgi:hypothetical protein
MKIEDKKFTEILDQAKRDIMKVFRISPEEFGSAELSPVSSWRNGDIDSAALERSNNRLKLTKTELDLPIREIVSQRADGTVRPDSGAISVSGIRERIKRDLVDDDVYRVFDAPGAPDPEPPWNDDRPWLDQLYTRTAAERERRELAARDLQRTKPKVIEPDKLDNSRKVKL